MKPQQIKTFGQFALALKRRALGQGGDQLRALGLSEDVFSAGGALVPEQFAQALSLRIYEQSLASMCTVVPTKLPGVRIPAVDETSRADGARFGGVDAQWLPESAALTPSKPKVAQLKHEAKKLGIAVWSTGELDDDAAAFENWLTAILVGEAGAMLNAAIIAGTGAGMPLGILGAPGTVEVAKEGSQAAGTINSANLLSMYARLWGPSRRTAVWLCNEATDAKLIEAFVPHENKAGNENAGGSQIYVFGSDGTPRILGRPVLVCEHSPAIGSRGDIILADLSQYVLADRGMRLLASEHVDFTSDQVLYKLTHRIDGAPSWRTPCAPKSGGATLSAFVTLAERT